MTQRTTFVWSLVLLASDANSLAHSDDAPRLPDQYAEALLEVEGMI
jgi:hypothetical protein